MANKLLVTDRQDKTIPELAEFFRTIASKLEEGQMTITTGDGSVTLEPPKTLGFRFKVYDDVGSSGNVQRKVAFNFRWYIKGPKTAGGDNFRGVSIT